MSRYPGLSFVLVVALGASCTEGRPASQPTVESTSSPDGAPRCDASPGGPPEGFVLVRSRDFSYTDHMGVRQDYEDAEGRLLVYLLGVMGEMGEGSRVAEDVTLRGGDKATLFGDPRHDSWSVVWSGTLPCPQMAVIGNGFTREAFLSSLREIDLLSGLPPER